jgi:hypothetical protein
MQNETYVFTAVNIEDPGKKKYQRLLYIAGFIVGVVGLIISLMNGNRIGTFSFSMFAVIYGISLLPQRKQAPLTLTINNTGFDFQNAESDKYHDWKEIKMAQHNGRYLDVFWGSSFRKSIDLQMFAAKDQLEIVRLAGRYLAEHNVFISEKDIIATTC